LLFKLTSLHSVVPMLVHFTLKHTVKLCNHTARTRTRARAHTHTHTQWHDRQT